MPRGRRASSTSPSATSTGVTVSGRSARWSASTCAKEKRTSRELLDNKDIKAVTIATPDHWHTAVAIDALRKGKDVYCEKPLTLTIGEGSRFIADVASRRAACVFRARQPARPDALFPHMACELVRNGRIGARSR